MNLYEQIGEKFIRKAIREFYSRAFVDPMICHFFMNSDFEHIVSQQALFAIAMLDGPKEYDGLPLKKAHQNFKIRSPHFGRRQVLMAEVLQDLNLDANLRLKWLEREEKLRPIILNN